MSHAASRGSTINGGRHGASTNRKSQIVNGTFFDKSRTDVTCVLSPSAELLTMVVLEEVYPVQANEATYFVVLQWPRDLPAGPMMRYPFKFHSKGEAEEFRNAVQASHPDLEFAVQQLSEN